MLDSLGCVPCHIGHVTLTFNYSGRGALGDEIIIFDPLIEDFRSTSGWLADQGSARQIYVDHEFGAVVVLRSRSPVMQTYVLVSLVPGPLSYDWNLVFSDVQLSDLEYYGATTVPDDPESVRRQFAISKCTLADMSMASGEGALRGFNAPVLITHDSSDEEIGLFDRTREVFHLLPDDSLIEMIAVPDGIAGEYTSVSGVPIIDEAADRALTTSGSAHLPTLADAAVKWASRWVPVSC